jgi:two-component sensor histidine kinase
LYRSLILAVPDYGDSVLSVVDDKSAALSPFERSLLINHVRIIFGDIVNLNPVCDSLISVATRSGNNAMRAEAFLLRSNFRKLAQHYAESVWDMDSALVFLGNDAPPEVDVAFKVAVLEVYRAARRFEAGIDLFNELVLSIDASDIPDILKCQVYHRGAALFHGRTSDREEVMRYSEKAMYYAERSNHMAGKAIIWNEVGAWHYNRHQYLKAVGLLRRSIEVWRRTKQYPNLCNTLLNQIRVYTALKQFDEVNKRLKEVGEILRKYPIEVLKPEYYTAMSSYFADLGRMNEAKLYLDTAIEYKIKQSEEYYKWELISLSTQLKISEKSALLHQRNLELVQMQMEVEEGKTEKSLLWAILLVTMLFMVVLGLLYKRLLRQRQMLKDQQTMLVESNVQLRENINMKNLLLREVHHRVKNNLAVLGGIIYMKSAQANDVEAGKAYADVLSSIRTIADLHNNLVSGQPGARVDLSIYLPKILKSITGSLTDSELEISFRTEIDPLEVDLDRALNLALLINEIVSNACKYAFAGRSEGEIICMLKAKEKNFESLIIGDNGIGLEEKVKNKTERSFGLEFIQVLSEHMLLKVQINNDIGTVYHFTPA